MSSPESYFGVEHTRDHLQEQEERRKEEALKHLIESGRADGRETAERYLDTLNAIKEKIVHFIRDEVSSGTEPSSSASEPRIEYGHDVATLANLDQITVDRLDRNKPELWILERIVDSAQFLGVRDRLQIKFSKGPVVDIFPDFAEKGRYTLDRLQQYLTQEDLTFVMKEYSFATKDLEKWLRTLVDRIARNSGTAYSWKHFSPTQENESHTSSSSP